MNEPSALLRGTRPLRVEVAWAEPSRQAVVTLDLPEGATVRDAVAQSGLGLVGDVDTGALACAIFGRRVDANVRLADDDRVEITRPLVCDPKAARRRRAAGNRSPSG